MKTYVLTVDNQTSKYLARNKKDMAEFHRIIRWLHENDRQFECEVVFE